MVGLDAASTVDGRGLVVIECVLLILFLHVKSLHTHMLVTIISFLSYPIHIQNLETPDIKSCYIILPKLIGYMNCVKCNHNFDLMTAII